MRFFAFAAAVVTLNVTTSAEAAKAPVLRKDLGDEFSALVCGGGLDGLPSRFWLAKIYDAQVEGRFVESRAGLPLTREVLERKARTLARVRHFASYAVGSCPNGSGWIAALPSAKPLSFTNDGGADLSSSELDKSCTAWRVDFAPREVARPRELDEREYKAGLKKLGHGVLAVTCQPKTPRWSGPVLRYLAPIGEGPAAAVPGKEALAQTPDLGSALLAWMNRVRAEAKLPALTQSQVLFEKAQLLAIDRTVQHDRSLLQKAARELAEKDLRFIGENRVKAADAEGLAWLLWNSPRHRELLLNAEATVAAVAHRTVGEQKFAVIVLGQQNAPLVSKAGTKPAAAKR